jgi:hypothetical protein
MISDPSSKTPTIPPTIAFPCMIGLRRVRFRILDVNVVGIPSPSVPQSEPSLLPLPTDENNPAGY